jgi:hypothetical protein
MTTLRRRIIKLETAFGDDDEVTFEEVVRRSMRKDEPPDPAFDARVARSNVGKTFAEIIEKNKARVAAPGNDGALPENKHRHECFASDNGDSGRQSVPSGRAIPGTKVWASRNF